MSDPGTDFQNAQAKVKALTRRPANEELLNLYALYKQGIEGDVSGERPGMLDLKGRVKYDAWAQHQGTTKDAAKREYVALVESLIKKYG